MRVRNTLAALFAWLTAQAPAWAVGASGVRVWLPDGVTTTSPLIDQVFYLILWITGAAFVLVQVVLVWFLIRYRRVPGRRAAYTHGNTAAEVIWTAIPALILVGLAWKSQDVWVRVKGTPPPADVEIAVTGQQFAWNVHYPGADGAFGRTDPSLVDEAGNPIGLDRTDPAAQDDLVTVNQMHLPAGKTVLIHLRSKDVLHSFFVPQFRMKLDAVPGMTGRLWVQAVKTGNFEIACAELCGLGHYRMRGYLVIESESEFATWLAQTLAEQNA